jgi:hypothetical protein
LFPLHSRFQEEPNNTHIAAVLRHAAEQIDHEFSVLQLRILPGGERTAHASRES